MSVIIFLIKDNKIDILKLLSYFFFYYEDKLIVGMNNCGKWLYDVFNIFISEDMKYKLLGLKM